MPAAVAISASAMPGATAWIEVVACWVSPLNAMMMPTTVPNSPMNGDALAVEARYPRLFSSLVVSPMAALCIARWTSGFDDYELAATLQRQGVAATPVLDVSDLLRDQQFRARDTFPEVAHPLGFRETIYGAYVKTSGVAAPIRPGPIMGQDNERVFKGLLGISEYEYRSLVEEQVIF